MTRPDDLTRALARNGAYDPEKAEELRKKMVGVFVATTRKVERYLWARSCLFAWLAVFAAAHFMHSSTTKALLFYGLLTLVFVVCMLHAKTWYLIATTKVGLLKAIHQQESGAPVGASASTPREHREVQVPFVDGLPRWERCIWYAAIIGGGLLILAVKGIEVQGVEDPWDFGRGGSLTAEGCLTLAADGSGTEVTEISLLHQGTLPRRGLTIDAPAAASTRYTDSYGNQLPAQGAQEQGRVRYTVGLSRPIMPGRRFGCTMIQERPQWATEGEGTWTCSADKSYGWDTNEFFQAVVLPEGAEIVSVTPCPVANFLLAKKPVVRFHATRGHNEPFKYTVQYRLTGKARD
jgi:hypothetical protein